MMPTDKPNGASAPTIEFKVPITEEPLAGLEKELRDATARANAEHASDAVDEGLDPNIAGENAAHAVHKCLEAAEHIRHMGEEFLAIAQTVKATGDALALDIENRAAHFDNMMRTAREYAQLTHSVFAQERAKLNSLNLSGGGG